MTLEHRSRWWIVVAMGQQHHPTVLIVEDEGIVRLDAAETLREAGFRVVEAADAREAMQVVEARGDIDVMFTDVNMPGPMNGLELAHRVRRSRPDIRVILTSGAMRIPPQEIPDDGVFVRKPYSPEIIARTVRRMVA
ncbi:MAG TPA: response regulator [Caulobacteraceae bacterium]|nr:response regulator [Caulobacteraceae bacterium]